MSLFRSNEISAKELEDKCLNVRKARCPQNHPCPSVRVCPVGALTQKGFAAPSVDASKCVKCGKCVRSCPMKALVIEQAGGVIRPFKLST